MDITLCIVAALAIVGLVVAVVFALKRRAKSGGSPTASDAAEKKPLHPGNSKLQRQLAETTSKCKTLEEDLEDLEDEKQSLEKKLAGKKQECDRLQKDKQENEKKIEGLTHDVQQQAEQIETLQRENSERMSALDFVHEILTAKNSGDTDMSKYYQRIDRTEDFVENTLKKLLGVAKDKGIVFASQDTQQFVDEIDKHLRRWAVTTRKRWIANKTAIAFVGQFSAGKTSIVNRLLSQDDPNIPRLPVSAQATTAIPTYITGGAETIYRFFTPANELKRITEDTFRRVDKQLLDKVQGVSSLIRYFVMTYKNPQLEEISLLDTPGFSSNDDEDSRRTIEVINECDALFWVFDVNNGEINRASMRLMHEYLTRPLYIVINKVDTVAPTEVDRVEAHIEETLRQGGVETQGILRFSAKEPLQEMMDVIHSIVHSTDSDRFEDNLKMVLSEVAEEADLRKNEAEAGVRECEDWLNENERKICECQETLKKKCDELLKLGEDKDPWFGSKYRKYTEEESVKLKKGLDEVKERTDTIDKLDDDIPPVAEKCGKMKEARMKMEQMCDHVEEIRITLENILKDDQRQQQRIGKLRQKARGRRTDDR